MSLSFLHQFMLFTMAFFHIQDARPHIPVIGDCLAGMYMEFSPPGQWVSRPVNVPGTASFMWKKNRLPGAQVFFEERLEPELVIGGVAGGTPIVVGAQLLVILVGTNDAAYLVQPPIYRTHMEEVIRDAKDFLVQRILLVIPPPVFGNPARETLLAQYRPLIQEMCDADPVVFCGPDLSARISESMTTDDGVHPTLFGKLWGAFHLAVRIRGVLAEPVP